MMTSRSSPIRSRRCNDSDILRSGIEILATHPKLYWHDDSKPGTEWARFTRKVMPWSRIYDTLGEEEDYSPFISLPGRAQLGVGSSTSSR
jgi:hypothetical protein